MPPWSQGRGTSSWRSLRRPAMGLVNGPGRVWDVLAVTHPVVPDELDDLAGVRVLVGGLGQPADYGLVVSVSF